MNLRLYIVDGVGRFDFKGDGLAREGLYENLHDGLSRLRQYHPVIEGMKVTKAIAPSPRQCCRPQPSAEMLDQQDRKLENWFVSSLSSRSISASPQRY